MYMKLKRRNSPLPNKTLHYLKYKTTLSSPNNNSANSHRQKRANHQMNCIAALSHPITAREKLVNIVLTSFSNNVYPTG